MGGHGGTTSTTPIRIGAGSRMKLTCPYRPRTTTHRAPAAKEAATRASCVGIPVSVSGESTNAVCDGPASNDIAVTGENNGASDSLLTSTTAQAPPDQARPDRATMYLVRR